MQKYLFLGLIGLFLVSCARLDPGLRMDFADSLAEQHGFIANSWQVGGFTLKAYQRFVTATAAEMTIYIEGDGLAYQRRHRPSANPTPVKAFTLQLAVQDPGSHVLYLARPCQYLNDQELADCQQKFWTSHRYSEPVIHAYMQLLDDLRQQYSVQRFTLIGYSGGGVIATLLAARRDDISSILTIAANLDLKAWTDHHGLQAMTASLNPSDKAKQLKTVRQRHLAGANDHIVPPLVLQSYQKALGTARDSDFQIIEDFDHQCCWQQYWPDWLQWFYK